MRDWRWLLLGAVLVVMAILALGLLPRAVGATRIQCAQVGTPVPTPWYMELASCPEGWERYPPLVPTATPTLTPIPTATPTPSSTPTPSLSSGQVPRVSSPVPPPTSTPLPRPTEPGVLATPHAVSRPAASPTPTRGRHEVASPRPAAPVAAQSQQLHATPRPTATPTPTATPVGTPVPSLVCGWGYLRDATTGHTYRVRLVDCEHIPHGDPRVNQIDWGALLAGAWTYTAD